MLKKPEQKYFTRIITMMITIGCLFILGGCVTMAPVNMSFESAKTLKKNQIEVMGNYSAYYFKGEVIQDSLINEKVNENYGFRIGYGINDRFDLKFRYERLVPKLEADKEVLDGMNYFALTPRYGIIKDYMALSMDVGMYQFGSEGDSDNSFFFSPRLALTVPAGNILDISLTNKFDIFPSDDAFYWGLNLGMGISTNSGNWMLRPEFGLMKDLDAFNEGTYKSWGVAIICKINPAK